MWKRWAPTILIGLAAGLFFGGRAYVLQVNQSHPAPWPMPAGGSGARYTTSATFPKDPQVLWEYPVHPNTFETPLIDEDGSVYLVTNSDLHVVGADGERRWSWSAPTSIRSMALSRHGSLYIMTYEDLYAFDRQGRLEWKVRLPAQPDTRLVVGQGGNLYYCSSSELHALTVEGKSKWHKSTGGGITACPVETAGGLVLVATDRDLIAFRPTGEIEWQRALGTPFAWRQGLAADADGHIYLRTLTSLLVLNEEGEITSDQRVTRYQGANIAVGAGVVQEGRARRDSSGLLIWERSVDPRTTQIATLVDGQGQTLAVLQSGPGGVLRQISLWDREGGDLWTLPDRIRPLTEVAVNAKGDFCFVASVPSVNPIALVCMGDRNPQ